MKEMLFKFFKGALTLYKLEEERIQTLYFMIESNIDALLMNELKEISKTHKDEIESLNCKDISLEEKCLFLIKQYLTSDDLELSFEFVDSIKVYEAERNRLASIYVESQEENTKNITSLLVDLLKRNAVKYEFTGYPETQAITVSTEKEDILDFTARMMGYVLPKTLERSNFYYVFDKDISVKTVDEIYAKQIPHIKLIKSFGYAYNINPVKYYKVPMPEELMCKKSNLAMFFAMYLDVYDKDGAFFKKENYDVDKINEYYTRLNDDS